MEERERARERKRRSARMRKSVDFFRVLRLKLRFSISKIEKSPKAIDND